MNDVVLHPCDVTVVFCPATQEIIGYAVNREWLIQGLTGSANRSPRGWFRKSLLIRRIETTP